MLPSPTIQPMLQEDIVARTFAKYGFRLDVTLSYARIGREPYFPYVKVASMVEALDRHGKLYKLLGLGREFDTLEKCGPALMSFWDSYKLMHGSHQLFQFAEDQQIPLSCCLPIYIHGDEGVTYKKDGCLVVSFHSPIGLGTRSHRMGPLEENEEVEPRMNFVGHAFKTRFLIGALLRDFWTQWAEYNSFYVFLIFFRVLSTIVMHPLF